MAKLLLLVKWYLTELYGLDKEEVKNWTDEQWQPYLEDYDPAMYKIMNRAKNPE